MPDKALKHREGTVFKSEDSTRKMEVELTGIQAEGDYQKDPVYIYHDWCVKCGICAAFCPTKTLALKSDGSPYVKNPEKCIHCEMCDRLCPNFAITGARR